MRPRFNLWVEIDGDVALSAWRVGLLEAIQASGSIRAAAGQLHLPYRRAWEKVHEMEARLGRRLLETEVGGEGGGGAHLTEAAQEYVARFHLFESGLEQEIQERYRRAFGAGIPSGAAGPRRNS
ncbi:MAG TPA: LysR family transcriptional regulator [Anaerolineales bacterium]|nr:LysR family transcriptional regulator [Anaerolineales bacterium]